MLQCCCCFGGGGGGVRREVVSFVDVVSPGLGFLVAGLAPYESNTTRLPEYDPERCDVRLCTDVFRRQRDVTATTTLAPGRSVVSSA